MSNLWLVFACLGIGAAFRWKKVLPASTPSVLNAFIIHLSLPALTLLKVHPMRIGADSLIPVSMAWIVFCAAAATIGPIGRKLRWDPGVIGALILTAGLGNTAFVGFPLIEAIYGPQGLPIAILADQPGTFLAASTLGILTASLYSTHGFSAAAVMKKILFFPPLLSILVAIALKPLELPPTLLKILERLADTLAPLALVSVGFQLTLESSAVLKKQIPKMAVALSYKLLLAPLLILALFAGIFEAKGFPVRVVITEAAMGPMVTSTIIATEYGLAPQLATLTLGAGILISLATVPVWAFLLRGI